MNTWIESHVSVARHHKTRRLSRKLGIPVAACVGHLHCLWHWAMEFASGGDVTRFAPDELADAAMFRADDYVDLRVSSEDFIKALIDTDWIDEDEGGRRLHNWWKYAGGIIEIRRQAKESGLRGNHKRWHEDRGVVEESCPFCRGDDGPESPPDGVANRPESPVPDLTRPNLTEPKSKPSLETFERFWNEYPTRGNGSKGSKKLALAAWNKLSQPKRQVALERLPAYASANRGFTKDAERYLKHEMWDSVEEPTVRRSELPDL